MEKTTSTDTAPSQAVAKPSLKARFTTLFNDYGAVAIGVYFAIFALCIAGFAIALRTGLDTQALGERLGVHLDGAGGTAGTLFAAWLLTKAIQVPRIFATLVLTPLVGRLPFIARLLHQRRQEPKH
ncbi:MAG: FAM210A/B-like domain-containing protein [Hyalangium sp.]|uniref:FAM210A/B-like domain-containing protein n=1 Tax=Hyalangium sp. TaxID=2028555 RepID=UPI00389ACD82